MQLRFGGKYSLTIKWWTMVRGVSEILHGRNVQHFEPRSQEAAAMSNNPRMPSFRRNFNQRTRGHARTYLKLLASWLAGDTLNLNNGFLWRFPVAINCLTLSALCNSNSGSCFFAYIVYFLGSFLLCFFFVFRTISHPSCEKSAGWMSNLQIWWSNIISSSSWWNIFAVSLPGDI